MSRMLSSGGSETAIIVELGVRLQLKAALLFKLLRTAETEIPRHAIHCPFKVRDTHGMARL